MADRKISDLTALTAPASGDYLPIVDISESAAASKNKRITVEELMRGAPDGTAAAPSIAFESDPNTGIYSPGADQVAISTGGTQKFAIDSLNGNPIIENEFPTIAPSLDLAFALTKQLDPRVTFTRASSGTYVDSAGVIQTATTDVPRFDHNPTTGESLGLLVEEARVNSIRNNTNVGAVAGTPGTLPTNWALAGAAGLTSTVAGVGTLNGISYIDVQLVGTSSGTFTSIPFEPATQVAATNAQAWTISSYLSVVAGSVAGLSMGFVINQFNSGGSFLAQLGGPDIAPSLNSSLTRFSFASTTNQATVAFVRPFLSLNYASGVAIDITLRIGLPQLEQGAFATSPILTSTAAVTRSADVASITGSAFSSWYRADEGTVLFDGRSAPVNNIAQFSYDISNGTGNERIFSRRNISGLIATTMADNGVTQGGADLAVGLVIPASTAYTSAYSYAANNLNLVVNGSSPSLFTTASTPTPDRLNIGQNFVNTQTFNGPIRRICFWPQRLANSTLQQITQ